MAPAFLLGQGCSMFPFPLVYSSPPLRYEGPVLRMKTAWKQGVIMDFQLVQICGPYPLVSSICGGVLKFSELFPRGMDFHPAFSGNCMNCGWHPPTSDSSLAGVQNSSSHWASMPRSSSTSCPAFLNPTCSSHECLLISSISSPS